MSVELNALVEATKISKTEEIAGNTFYEGVLNGVDVVLVKAGIGKVLAASCAETLIDTYHVGGIVFTGIARRRGRRRERDGHGHCHRAGAA